MRPVLRHTWPLFPLLLIGCREAVMAPAQRPPTLAAAGLMEITITGIGTPQQRADVHALAAPSTQVGGGASATGGPRRGPAYATHIRQLIALPDTGATDHDGTVHLVPVSTASFTWGTRGSGGYRYVSANYRVRNATQGGTAYGNDRTNLTFLAVNTPSTLSGTAISTLKRFDGTDAAAGLATQILPTGWAGVSATLALTSQSPDVLQAYTESEIAATTAPADVTSILPYGFVVRNPAATADRTLAANPDTSQFDGVVTFAFKVPLQSTPAADPFTITAVFLPVDDNEAWVTQSLEEADTGSVTAVEARKTSLGAQVRSFLGTTVGVSSAELMCGVRTAGTAAAPTSFLPDNAVDSVSPGPYTGAASFLDANTSFAATFSHTMSKATSATFAVNSLEGGRAFLGETYGGAGTSTLTTRPGRSGPATWSRWQ